MASDATGVIQIIKVPGGKPPQPPLWVRDKWLYLMLPCQPVLGRADTLCGILSRAPIYFDLGGRYGVKVPVYVALEIMHATSPMAANYYYTLKLAKEDHFFFEEGDIRIISGVRRQVQHVADDMETGTMELPGR